MSQAPATAHKYAALSLDQMIGLFLAQLYSWLIRYHESGAPFAPADMAQNVTKADALVHAFIRSRAAAQLEQAGYTDAARAMRVPIGNRAIFKCSRDASHRIEHAQGCHTELSSGAHEQAALSPHCANEKFASANENAPGASGPTSVGAPASTQNEPAQGCTPQTPAELLKRLEAIIEQFEQAEAIGSILARIVVCTLLYMSPGEISAPHSIRPYAGRSARPAVLNSFYARLASREQKREAVSEANRREFRRFLRLGPGPPSFTPMGQGPPHQWPPPTHTVLLDHCLFRRHQRRLVSTPPPRHRASCILSGMDPRSSLGSAVERGGTELISRRHKQREGAGAPAALATAPSKTSMRPEPPLRRQWRIRFSNFLNDNGKRPIKNAASRGKRHFSV